MIWATISKTTLKKKKCKKAKWLSEEALQIDEKEEKWKAKEKGKHTQLNAEFQRRARRNNKAYLNEQYKETEEDNRMEKPRERSLQENWRYQVNIPCKDEQIKRQKWQAPNRNRKG